MFNRLIKACSDYYWRLMNIPGKIDDVAWGFAIGLWVGMVPWYGLQTAITLALTRLFRKNLAAGVIGSLASNPLTAWPLFWLQYEVGRNLLGLPRLILPSALTPNLAGLWALSRFGGEIVFPLLAGGAALGLAAGGIGFLALRSSLRAYRLRIYLRKHGHGSKSNS